MTGAARIRMRRPRVALLALAFALLVVGWIFATRPWAAPDEPSHYQRALGIAYGHILGPKIDYPDPGLTPAARAFIDHDTRAVRVPARLAPPLTTCVNGQPDLVGSCIEADPNGNFPPLPYLLPAVALRASSGSANVLWLMRGACALVAIAFLTLAAFLLWGATAWSLLGLLVAATPMVLYSSSILNSSGMQICASLAFGAAVVRLTRDPVEAPRWVWAALAGAGAVTILSGPIGLEFALLQLVLLGVLTGHDRVRELRAAPRARRWTGGSVLLAAAVISLAYSRIAGFKATVRFAPLFRNLDAGIGQIRPILHDAVGTFGGESVPLPTAACWVWWVLAGALVLGAFWLGTRRERVLLPLMGVIALAFPVLFYAFSDRFSGFGLQGREVLPALTVIPLCAGEVLYRRSAALAARRAGRALICAAIALVAAFQAYAWWYDARIAAGAKGTVNASAPWTPPLGWVPWACLVGLGTLALLTLAASELTGMVRTRAVPARVAAP